MAPRQSNSAPGTASTIIHVVGLLSFGASFAWIPNITNPLHRGFGGPYQFLTIIALTVSTATFGLGLLADILRNRTLFRLKNQLALCATPLDALVSVLYWSLHFYDKKLVTPPGHALPLVPDISFHAMPAIMLTLDLLLCSPRWSISASRALVLHSVLMFSYWGWLEYCYSFNEWYPYPLLMKISPPQKLYLCIFTAVLMTGSTLGLKSLQGFLKRATG